MHTPLKTWEAEYKLFTLWINLVGEGSESNTEGIGVPCGSQARLYVMASRKNCPVFCHW